MSPLPRRFPARRTAYRWAGFHCSGSAGRGPGAFWAHPGRDRLRSGGGASRCRAHVGGRALRSASHEGITGLGLALRRLGELACGETGSVRATTGATSVRHFMPETVDALRDRRPGAVLESRTQTSGRSCFGALA
ncbi:hypothetical protein NQP46_02375 [Streptomyces albus]|nr:hypothetical protein NQP46_02375 [Streptomyces albus]